MREIKFQDHKEILLSLIRSLCLCDHMGDVADKIKTILKLYNIEIQEEEDDWFCDVDKTLEKLNIKFLYELEVIENLYKKDKELLND
jgi:hypothetical protein